MASPIPSTAGLDFAEAARRLAQYGPNDPAPKKHRSHLVELLLQFANPLVAILLFASVVSAFVGELANATIMIVIVSLSVAVNFAARTKCVETYEALCTRGFRVLAVATRSLTVRPTYTTADERELCLVGFLAFADPPLEERRMRYWRSSATAYT